MKKIKRKKKANFAATRRTRQRVAVSKTLKCFQRELSQQEKQIAGDFLDLMRKYLPEISEQKGFAYGEATARAENLKKRQQRRGRPLNQEKTVELRRMYNELFDLYKGSVFRSQPTAYLLLLLNHGGLRPGQHIASLSTGTGLVEAFIAKNIVPNGRVYSIDFAQKAIDFQQKVKRMEGLDNFVPILADSTQTGLPDRSVNTVIELTGTHLPQGEMPLIEEAARILKRDENSRLILERFYFAGQKINTAQTIGPFELASPPKTEHLFIEGRIASKTVLALYRLKR